MTQVKGGSGAAGHLQVQPDLSVTVAGIKMKNPVMTASGTFGFGREYAGLFDISLLGAIVVKGLSPVPWPGNSGIRLAETKAGLLNSIGLQNPGVDHFLEVEWPCLRELGTPVIVNIVGKMVDEYVEVVRRLEGSGVAGVEVNISCPNIKEGGLAFGTDPGMAGRVTRAVRNATKLPVIVKLSPNVTDITEIARAVEASGADALSLINTLTGMAIDIRNRRPVLGNVVGGLSGPAIKPVALRMVWQVAGAVEIPLIGIGGIMTWSDALEFIMAGATAVAVGTASFVNPMAPLQIIEGLGRYLQESGTNAITDLIGAARI